jgi:putative membrane protein
MARTDRIFFAWNAVISTAAVAFIGFILRREAAPSGPDLSFVPAFNALCNTLSATCLVAGYVAIRHRAIRLHRFCMVTAFALSAVFLVGYLAYHYVHGDTAYTGVGWWRVVYFVVLVTHVVLSMAVVPGALTSFYFAWTGQFDRHRRLNRVFLPVWLYVSVTGVVIYFLLRG